VPLLSSRRTSLGDKDVNCRTHLGIRSKRLGRALIGCYLMRADQLIANLNQLKVAVARPFDDSPSRMKWAECPSARARATLRFISSFAAATASSASSVKSPIALRVACIPDARLGAFGQTLAFGRKRQAARLYDSQSNFDTVVRKYCLCHGCHRTVKRPAPASRSGSPAGEIDTSPDP
jgi:hypothetical protein